MSLACSSRARASKSDGAMTSTGRVCPECHGSLPTEHEIDTATPNEKSSAAPRSMRARRCSLIGWAAFKREVSRQSRPPFALPTEGRPPPRALSRRPPSFRPALLAVGQPGRQALWMRVFELCWPDNDSGAPVCGEIRSKRHPVCCPILAGQLVPDAADYRRRWPENKPARTYANWCIRGNSEACAAPADNVSYRIQQRIQPNCSGPETSHDK